MNKKRKKTTDAVTILHHRYIKGDPERLAAIEAEREKIKIAEQVYALRIERGLTQRQLAELMGTTQSVISRIESTDYENESIDTLQKLAAALKCNLDVQFVPEEKNNSTENAHKDKIKHLLLNTLTRSEKFLVFMYYYKEMTMKEIADVWGIPESQVSKMHLSIITRLKSQMDLHESKTFDVMFEEAFV